MSHYRIVAWSTAARPKTLVASIMPVIIGHMISRTICQVNLSYSVLAAASAVCIQIGTNYFNDVVDFQTGVDGLERKGPKRLLANNLATPARVKFVAHSFFFLALLLGIPLVVRGGLPIFILGVTSLLCGYGYSGFPLRLAYRGLSEPFVIVFFGIAAVGGVVWLQCMHINYTGLILGTQVGLLSTVLLVVNNLRDIAEDRQHSKRTLAARFGRTFGICEIFVAFVTVAALCFAWPGNGIPIGLLFLVPAAFVCQDLIRGLANESLNLTLLKAAMTHLLFSILAIFYFEALPKFGA